MLLNWKNYINGCWVGSSSNRHFAVYNPADLREKVSEYPLTSSEEASNAIEGASEAFKKWRSTGLAERVAILRQAAQIIRLNRQEYAEIITQENGKLLSESLTEIDAAVLELEYQIGEGERQFGRAGDCYRADLFSYSRKEPLGVVSIIVPWNFPFNVPWRKLAPALLAGNSVILKPASQTPGVGELVAQVLEQAGLPSGVLQFVTGSGSELSEVLVSHPLIRAVTFTGSTEVGRKIAQMAGADFTRTQLEMGGKNPMVVLADCDIQLAAQDAVIGAFSCAGQWCTATSRLVVEESIADDLVAQIKTKIKTIKIGPGNRPESTMGPVAGEHQLLSVLAHIEKAKHENAQFVAGGNRCAASELSEGCFIEPTLIDHVSQELSVASEEVFGPVLSVMRVKNYSEALRVANDVPYGLSSSIYTRDLDRAIHFVENTEVGLTHVNAHSAYKEPQQVFGGIKESGFGLPEAGSIGIQFFQDDKSIYIKRGFQKSH